MKSFAILSVLVAAAAAQDLMGLPTCAVECTNKHLGATGCKLTDYKCICSNKEFLSGIAQCVTTACPATELAKVASFSQNFCGDNGAPLPSSVLAAASQALNSNGTAAGATQTSDSAAPSESAGASAGEMNRPAALLAGVAALLGAIVV